MQFFFPIKIFLVHILFDLNSLSGLFALIAALPVFVGIYIWTTRSWIFLSKKEKELLKLALNGNGQIQRSPGSWNDNNQRKVMYMIRINGNDVCSIIGGKAEYEERMLWYKALTKLEKKGYVNHNGNLGYEYFTLTSEAHLKAEKMI